MDDHLVAFGADSLTGTRLGHLDGPSVTEHGRHLPGRPAVLRQVRAWQRLRVAEVVSHHQQGAGRRHGRGEMTEQGLLLGLRDVQEVGGDQVVGSRRRNPGQVSVQPGDGETALAGALGRPLDRHARDVGGGDLPSARGEPEGVAALARPGVQCRARPKTGYFGDQDRVGVAAPDLRLGPVPLVPGLLSVRGLMGVRRLLVARVLVARVPVVVAHIPFLTLAALTARLASSATRSMLIAAPAISPPAAAAIT